MKIGFIGLGRMGHGMATRLLDAGHALVVFDPDEKQAARMAAAGAEVASTLSELARACDVVISMLPSDEILRSAALGEGGLAQHLRPGSIHMVSGTHGVPVMSALAAGHAAAGQVLVACHVLGRPDLAATGKLGLVPGGPADAVAKVRPLFAAIGDRVIEAGANPLSATAIKIANNFILGCAIEAMGEGMALVRKYDVDPLVFHQVLVGGLFNSTAYHAYGDLIAREDWGRVGASAVIGLKDADLALDAAQSVGVPLPSVLIWKAALESAIARGDAHLDWSVMAREQFRASGLE
jgi:3-hydroxyisobutyrate dehydrogenase-like beta-hydroxyacid dehydrogenase